MQNKTVNTKACIIATAVSNINKGIKINNGKKWNKNNIGLLFWSKVKPKPAITFNKVCPAIMLVNNRMDKLISLKK